MPAGWFRRDVTIGDTTGGFLRPTGPGYVRYEDLYQPGDTISEAMARLGAGSKGANSDGTGYITFPEGVFSCHDFYGVPGNSTAQYGIFVPHNALGLIGSGPGVPGSTDSGTIFTIDVDSSTVPLLPQGGMTPNSCNLMYHGTGTKPGVPYLYGQFQVIGTHQQNMYHGFSVKNPAGPVHFYDLVGFGGMSDNGQPPGETFILGMSGGHGPHLFERIYCDGNDTGGAITMEDTVNAVWRNVTSLRSITHCAVLFQAFNTQTFDCVLGPQGAHAAVHDGQPTFNHERTAGTVHTRLVQNGVKTDTDCNIVHSNDTYTTTIDGVACSTVNGSLTLIDVSGIEPAQAPYLRIQSGTPYNTDGFNGDTMTTPPTVLAADGVTKVPYQWQHGTVQVIS